MKFCATRFQPNVCGDSDGWPTDLNNVVHLELDQFEQHVDAALGRGFELDRTATDRADGAPDEVDVNLGGVPGGG